MLPASQKEPIDSIMRPVPVIAILSRAVAPEIIMRFVPALLIAALLAAAADARAGHLFCHHCRCHTNCKKICRLECGTKKETKIEYECETEDFCIPGPSHKHGFTYECGPHGHKHRKPIWHPTCAKVHTRTKLVKKEVTKEVPDYKWVVEEYCCICGVLVKIEREPATKKDDKAAGKSAPSKSDSKAQAPPDQLPLAEIEGVIPPSSGEPAEQYAAYYAGVADAELNDENGGEARPADATMIDGDGGDPPRAGTAQRLLERILGK